jgi:hypothetical protein
MKTKIILFAFLFAVGNIFFISPIIAQDGPDDGIIELSYLIPHFTPAEYAVGTSKLDRYYHSISVYSISVSGNNEEEKSFEGTLDQVVTGDFIYDKICLFISKKPGKHEFLIKIDQNIKHKIFIPVEKGMVSLVNIVFTSIPDLVVDGKMTYSYTVKFYLTEMVSIAEYYNEIESRNNSRDEEYWEEEY